MGGFVKFNRELESEDLAASDRNAFVLLAFIAMRARYRELRTDRHKLKVGEAFIGDYARMGFTRAEYRTALKNLVDYNHLEIIKSTNRGTIVRLCSPVFSVSLDSCNNHQDDQETTDQQPPSNQPVTIQQPLTKKDRSEDGEEVKNTPFSPSVGEISTPDPKKRKSWTSKQLAEELYASYPNFRVWWKAYPNRKKIRQAFEAWVKSGLEFEDQEPLFKVLALQKKEPQWQKNEGQFIPLGSTYLNQRQFEDDLTEIEGPGGGGIVGRFIHG